MSAVLQSKPHYNETERRFLYLVPYQSTWKEREIQQWY